MNPLGACILVVLVIAVFASSRRGAVLAMLAGVLFLSQTLQVEVASLNIFSMRFLELAGFTRIMARSEFSFRNLNKIDRALIWVYLFTPIVYCMRATEGQAYMIGQSVDAFLCYFTFRGLIHDLEELKSFLRAFVLLLAPFAFLVLYESLTHNNLFSLVGAGGLGWTRGDRFRCVGSFRNPDLLGTVGVSFAPLYMGMAWMRSERKLALFAFGLCLLIVWASNSGGPLCATSVGLIGWALWYARLRMQRVRRLMVAGLIGLDLIMKAPIWYVLARVSEITGGDGWHRSYLIDVSVQHLRLWWFAGMPIIDTWDWFEYSLGSGADIANTFISFGLNAGLGAIVLLLILLVRGFQGIGAALEKVRGSQEESSGAEYLLWGLGAMLAAHIANWLGITYFDQSYVLWFMQLAAISSVSASCVKAAITETHPRPQSGEEMGSVSPGMQFEHETS